MTCYWQTRRNRDSITFDEWVDLDLWEEQKGLGRLANNAAEWHPCYIWLYLGGRLNSM